MKQLRLIVPCVLVALACSDATGPDRMPTPREPRLASGGGGNTRCVGTLPPGTYQNVTVPEDARCVLEHSTVLGNVTAREGSRLTMFNVRVLENVHGLKADAVEITAFPLGAGSVGENIHIHGAESPEPGSTTVVINTVEVMHGNIHVENNNASGIVILNNSVREGSIISQRNNAVFFHTIQDNRVGQNVLVFRNTGPGPKSVDHNFVAGAVMCFGNEQPFVGGPNVAERTEGQCF